MPDTKEDLFRQGCQGSSATTSLVYIQYLDRVYREAFCSRIYIICIGEEALKGLPKGVDRDGKKWEFKPDKYYMHLKLYMYSCENTRVVRTDKKIRHAM